jgi:hypothetical protein
MKIAVDFRQMEELSGWLASFGEDSKRARMSALKSTGNMIRLQLKRYLRTGGHGQLKPLNLMTRKASLNQFGRWEIGRAKNKKPLSGLAQFARYRVDSKDEFVHIDLGKSKGGQPGRFDPALAAMLEKHQQGQTYNITEKMQRFFGATRQKTSKRPGLDFFPLRKDTLKLILPKRPVIDPVFTLADPKIMPHFTEKFFKAIERYTSGK